MTFLFVGKETVKLCCAESNGTEKVLQLTILEMNATLNVNGNVLLFTCYFNVNSL